MLGDNVIDLKGKIEIVPGDPAVFATAARTLPHTVFQRASHA
jgi:hypothetical protein